MSDRDAPPTQPAPKDIAAAPSNYSTGTPDKAFYTWTTLFKAWAGQATQKEIRGYNAAFDHAHAKAQCLRCETNRDWLFQFSPIVRYMREECASLGGNLGPHNVRCRNCTGKQRGGFSAEYGILLCANEDSTRKKLEETVAHEMVHAYDHLRWRFDELNMKHAACTEIRASMLSGECRYMRQFSQKKFKIMRQFQECVRSRAILSVAHRPQINDTEHARKVVDSVWDSCFNDTRPFDEIYR